MGAARRRHSSRRNRRPRNSLLSRPSRSNCRALAWASIGLGIALSLVANALLRSSFAGFGSGIAASVGAAVLALLSVGIVAAFLPARRAASINPVQALRSE